MTSLESRVSALERKVCQLSVDVDTHVAHGKRVLALLPPLDSNTFSCHTESPFDLHLVEVCPFDEPLMPDLGQGENVKKMVPVDRFGGENERYQRWILVRNCGATLKGKEGIENTKHHA